MTKTATVSKWGNARGIRLPEAFCQQLGISIGDEVSITIDKDKLVVTNSNQVYTLKARLEAWNGEGAGDTEYSWGEPVGEEVW